MVVDLQNSIMNQSDVRETVTNTAETSVAYNFDYATYIGQKAVLSIYAMSFSPDGLNVYLPVHTTNKVHQYTLSSRWDITTASLTASLDTAGAKDYYGIYMRPNGTKMYLTDFVAGSVDEYNLSTAWDITTATLLQSKDISAKSADPSGLFLREDGMQMFVSDPIDGKIYSYHMSTAWDVSTAIFVEEKAITGGGIFFSRDGQYFFWGDGSTTINRWALTTVFRISTASADQTLVVFPALNSYHVTFNPPGTRMYIVGANLIQQYQIKRGWR